MCQKGAQRFVDHLRNAQTVLGGRHLAAMQVTERPPIRVIPTQRIVLDHALPGTWRSER